MASDKSKIAPSLTPLVSRGLHLITQRGELLTRLQAVEQELIALGAGKYCDAENNVAQVIAAVPESTGAVSYALPKDGEAPARQLAGDEFASLFDRKIAFFPCEGFDAVAPKLLTPARARDIVKLCLVPGRVSAAKRAHVRWP